MPGIHAAAKAAGIKDPQARTFFNTIMEKVAAGERIYVKDFGTFFSAMRQARTIHSPQLPSGTADVPAHLVLRFRPSPVTRGILNGDPKPAKVKAAKHATTKAAPAPAAKPTKAKAAKPAPA